MLQQPVAAVAHRLAGACVTVRACSRNGFGSRAGFPSDCSPQAPVLVFPFPPMLAALKHSLPIGDQWLYEPKLDGFRGLLRHGTNGHVQLLSRNLRDLAPSFPELGRAARSLPAGTLLDGEI